MRRLAVLVLGLLLVLAAPAPALADSGMQIFVTLPSGRSVTLDVESSFSVEQVKVDLEGRIGLPATAQVLRFAGRVIEDGRTLADYNIQKESTVQLGYAAPVVFVDDTLPPFELDRPVLDGLSVNGFSKTYAITAGSVPAGILFDGASGAFTGTPTTLGPYDFTVTGTRDDGASLDLRFTGRVTPPVFGFMQVFVQLPGGRTLTVDTSSFDSVENLRTKLQNLIGILPTSQRLTFEGTALADGFLLWDYDIRNEEFLVLEEIVPATSPAALPAGAAALAGPRLAAAGVDPAGPLALGGLALVTGLALALRRTRHA